MNMQMLAQFTEDDYIESVRTTLLSVEQSIKDDFNPVHVVLDRLTDRLFGLHFKGYSFSEITLVLKRCGIEVSVEELKNYYHKAQEQRLKLCEQTLANYQRPEWNAVMERTAFIERGLQQALDTGRGLILYYQPQIEMRTGRVVGAEALVRWECNGTLIHPAEFIPVAEGSGLIVAIGEWALREACQAARNWQLMGLGGNVALKIAVNLSVKQFSPDLPKTVHEILCDAGLPTELLGLEITESFLVGGEDSLALLHTLQSSGVHLSIDDFGTGYSCLAALKELPLDTIKIDRAFVKDLGRDVGAAAVVGAIMDLARKLGMNTLAEGVETVEQMQNLQAMGCEICQGYLFSRPLAGDEFVDYVKRGSRKLGA